MSVKELIRLNNDKRKQLTKTNQKYYEDMLLYIRLSYNKSELRTEEILTELLDHLLEAQAEGKTAENIFGDDPKKYADEIVDELPKMVTKKRTLFITMIVLYFLATTSIFNGLFSIFNHYVLNIEGFSREFYIGSAMIKTIISIPVAFLLLFAILHYLRWSCFKKINKILEFFFFWLYGIISVGIFFVVIYFTPDIGQVFEMSVYAFIVLGVVLLILAHLIKRTSINSNH